MQFNLKDIFDNPFVEADMEFGFDLRFNLPFIGTKEVMHLRISGIRDDDGDFLPEFDVDLTLGGNLIVAENKEIELDPALLMNALGKGVGGVPELFEAVLDQLKANGITFPWE